MTEPPPTVSTEALNDYIDGRLSERERAQVEAAIATNSALAKELAALQSLNVQLSSLGASVLDEPVPERLRRIVAPNLERKLGFRFFSPSWRHGLAYGFSVLIAFVAGYVVNDSMAPQDPGLLRPFVEQAVLSHELFEKGTFSSAGQTISVSPEAELAGMSLNSPMRVPISLGIGLEPVAIRTLTGYKGAAIQVAYLDPNNQLTSLLVREVSDDADMPAKFTTQDELNVLYWIDGPLVYALVGDEDEQELRVLARSIYTSNAIGGHWMEEPADQLQPVSD